MKSRKMTLLTIATLFAILNFPLRLAGQDIQAPEDNHHKHRYYKLVDLGTLGGPISHGSVNGGGFRLLNDSGLVASYADLAVPRSERVIFLLCRRLLSGTRFLMETWRSNDLGALPENNNSAAGSINSRGWATGQSQSFHD